ncbi:MAG: Gfo/Idh/MocA family oxidoreductase [Bacteroidaceae bacterium]|jgi:hypothetical protein|nr:Gfo/Idh/MocA family oxidoreductase [Bacteroidaceae bacterium]
MVNISLIGLGQRGQATLERLALLSNANVLIKCDVETDWQEAASHPDVDLVWVCTPWEWHVRMAVFAMRSGKDVALEVPAAMTVAECETLLAVALETGRHCVMLENCCYDTWHLGVREIVRSGILGRVKHLEGAYAHTVQEGWMRSQGRRRGGNPYPTHALGPMCQLLPEGDTLDYLVSLSSPIPGDHTNTSLIRSVSGVSMLLHYDISTPRPYSRMQTVCGTLGFLQKYPVPIVQIQFKDKEICLSGDEAVEYVENFIPLVYKNIIAEGKKAGAKNLMNYMMDYRLLSSIEEMRDRRQDGNGDFFQMDMDVYDAVLWSSVIELTEKSALNASLPVKFPRF